MEKNKRNTAESVKSLFTGIVAAIVTIGVGLISLTYSVLEMWVTPQRIPAALFFVILISTIVGGTVAYKISVKKNWYIPFVFTALLFTVFLLLGMVLVEGRFQNCGLFFGASGAGGVVACVICLNKRKTRKKINVASRYFSQKPRRR